MSSVHPLDRPVWSVLTGRQSELSLALGSALRFAPDYGLFAATPDTSDQSMADLSALVAAHGDLALVEAEPPPPIPGVAVRTSAVCWQMVADELNQVGTAAFAFEDLTEADAPEMLALALLTKPGPIRSRTRELGPFIGVKQDGRLVAMAGRRLRVDGFTELSGVCTHPDHRGMGYAAALSRVVVGEILATGEEAFLHAFADHETTIAFYRGLGFQTRARMTYTSLGEV